MDLGALLPIHRLANHVYPAMRRTDRICPVPDDHTVKGSNDPIHFLSEQVRNDGERVALTHRIHCLLHRHMNPAVAVIDIINVIVVYALIGGPPISGVMQGMPI